MKKTLWLISILFISAMLLGACGDDKKKNENENNAPDVNLNEEQNKGNEEENNSVSNEENNIGNNETNENTNSEKPSKGDTGDQLDLKIGDTGTFDTVLGKYDMTLNSAELVDGEIEGEKSTRDGFIILELTIKNVGEAPVDLEDIIVSMEVASNLDHSGSTDHAAGFDTLKEFDGELAPGEEESAQFMTIVDDTENYYFRKLVGNIASGSSNQVIWTFSADEAK